MVVPISQRPHADKIFLFDVDDTLTPPRLPITAEMLSVLSELRSKAVVGFLGGSDFAKIAGQLAPDGHDVTQDWDYGFAENGLTAVKNGEKLPSQSFINFLGEEKYKQLVRFTLHEIADIDIPIKRGTFIEFRNGMVNISPIGRNASTQERADFEKFDLEHKVRAGLIAKLQKEFADWGLTYSVGGMISFDVFPNGWDKRFALTHLENEKFKEIHFFGDKTFPGGNDYEVYTDDRTIGHSVKNPADTIRQLKEILAKL